RKLEKNSSTTIRTSLAHERRKEKSKPPLLSWKAGYLFLSQSRSDRKAFIGKFCKLSYIQKGLLELFLVLEPTGIIIS
ncbi:MAG: hypothetical protein WBA22_09445, partial [Candidatus Methanofastidiosia archaeon]